MLQAGGLPPVPTRLFKGNMTLNTIMKNLFPVLMFVFFLSGCYNIGVSKRNNQFEKTSNSYRIYLRWGEYEKAAAFIKMRKGKPQELNKDYLKEIHITRYEIINEYISVDEEKFPNEIVVDVDIDFYPESSLTVKNFKYQQVWWYDVAEERWFLDGDLPDFRAME